MPKRDLESGPIQSLVPFAIPELELSSRPPLVTPMDIPSPSFDQLCFDSGLACPPGEDMARQEFKDEADTSKILARFGAGQSFRAPPCANGEVDFGIDLQSAIAAVDEANAAFARLPIDAQRFGSWRGLELAIASGQYPRKPAEAPAAPAGGSDGSASDSAPVTPPNGG